MKSVYRVWLAWLAIALAVPAASAQEAPKPVLVAVFPSYDELLADIDYLGQLAGQPQASQQIEQILALVTQGQGLAGLDKARPCGAALLLDGGQPVGAAFVPTKKVKDLLAALEGMVGTAEESQDHEGLLELSIESQTIYVKQHGQWAWFSNSPDMLAKVPKDPQRWIGPLAKRYDFAVQLRMQNIPEFYRQLAMEALRQGVDAARTELEDELQRKVVQMQVKQIEDLFTSLDRLTIGCRIDRKARNLAIGFEMTLVPDSAYGRLVAGYSLLPSHLAGFGARNAVFRLNTAVKIGPGVREYYHQQVKDAKQILELVTQQLPEDDPEAEMLAKMLPFLHGYLDFLDEARMAQGYDLAFSLEERKGRMFLATAVLMPGGPNFAELVNRGLAKLSEVAGDEVQVQRGVARQGGVTFHRVVLTGLGDEERQAFEQAFGSEPSLVLGVSRDGLFAAFGSRALENLRQRVAASKEQPPKKLGHFGICELSLRSLLKLIQRFSPDESEDVEDVLDALPAEGDKVRILIDLIPNGQQMQLVVDEGVLRALIAIGQKVQQNDAPPEF